MKLREVLEIVTARQNTILIKKEYDVATCIFDSLIAGTGDTRFWCGDEVNIKLGC